VLVNGYRYIGMNRLIIYSFALNKSIPRISITSKYERNVQLLSAYISITTYNSIYTTSFI